MQPDTAVRRKPARQQARGSPGGTGRKAQPKTQWLKRAQAQVFVDVLASQMPPGCEWYLAGSWRRGSPYVRDLDVIVIRRAGTFGNFQFPAGFTADVASGPKKAMGHLQAGNRSIRVDFWACPKKDLGAFLLWLTGPQNLVIRHRSKARRMGLLLNERGLFDAEGRRLDSGTEKSIFALLNQQWLEPSERERFSRPGPGAQTVWVASASGGPKHRVRIDGPLAECDCTGFGFYRDCRHIPQGRLQLARRAARKKGGKKCA